MKKTENKKTKVKGKKRPFFTISKKILALSLLPMIIVCALVATVGSRALEAGIEKQIEKALQIVGVSVDETYTNLYEGDYTKDKGGKVRKGGTSISGETQLIDGLQEKTGFQVSFLYGNMRLITTLTKPEGGRINGTGLETDRIMTCNPMCSAVWCHKIQGSFFYRSGDGDLRADSDGRTAVP